MLLDVSAYENMIATLREREKEMKCLYKVQEIINDNLSIDDFLMEIVKHIWGGWQYPMITRVKITYEGKVYKEDGWNETEWVQSADIVIDDNVLGKIEVYYTQFKKLIGNTQFLPEEQKLLNTIAANISSYIFNRKLLETLEAFERDQEHAEARQAGSFDLLPVSADFHWLWRMDMTYKIASKLDLEKFGVEAMYLIGSAKNATSGPASDIDIMLHFNGDRSQERELKAWFDGWSYCLSEINFIRTGHKTDGLIDLHIITDEDIRAKNSFASMIGSLDNSAKLIKKRSDG